MYVSKYQSPTGSTGHFARMNAKGHTYKVIVSIPNGLHWPFCRCCAAVNMLFISGINPQRAPLAILPGIEIKRTVQFPLWYQSPTGSTGHFAINRKRGIRRWQQWYQSPTGSTGHFAFEQGDGIETTFVVSIPNGLHWPFCRSKSDILDYKELHGINPQRAPLAILPLAHFGNVEKVFIVSIPNGLHWPFCRHYRQVLRRGSLCINPQRAPLAILPSPGAISAAWL